ncbi:hypothetical protein [Bartonella rattaustraliani]|uniref:hypothetical protein n=1 Tax=Bartonella rattaustraliani TaxID=481139 RepID=UPI0004769179|nr:hypothetical protein [Bartonella rattaustraliani]
MKRKITFFVIQTIVLTGILTGCASVRGPKKPPRCDGQQTRALNKDKWDWEGKGILFQEKTLRPARTPLILNTLESERATPEMRLNTTPLNFLNHENLSHKTAEVAYEKQ